MKANDIKRQLNRLRALTASTQQARDLAQKLVELSKTPYFQRVLLSGRDDYRPVKDRAEYMARYENYRDATESKVSRLLEEARQLPTSQGQRWNRRREVKIGIVADSFLFDSLKSAAHFVPITPENYATHLPRVDFFLLVSAWRGLTNEWQGLAQPKSAKRRLMESEVIPFAKSCGIPVVFYSKEDPPNYETFLSLAEQANYVFTSAEEMIGRYRQDLTSQKQIDVLQFAVNYEEHNPLGCMRHSGTELVFAGSWMSHKYPHRAESAAQIFDGAIEIDNPLFIIDRNLGLDPTTFRGLERYLYPERYLPHLHGPMTHEEVLQIQKLLPIGVNLNSVIDSQTMFANRVVELLAMGTMVISNYSAGMNSIFPCVSIVDSKTDVQSTLKKLNQDYIRYTQVEGIREAFSKNTAFERVDQLLQTLGICAESENHKIFVACENREDFLKFCDSQTADHALEFVPTSKLATLTGSDDGDLVLLLDNIPIESVDLVADAISAYRYSDVDSLRFACYDDYNADPYEPVEGDFLTDSVHALWLSPSKKFQDLKIASQMTILTSSSCAKNRREASEMPQLSVIVPIYNNGKHLVHKCFQSLLRSSVFDKSEILLIDDGSSDLKTKATVALLEKKFTNVRVFRFPEGGSGSASRPRNKGLEICRTPWIAYLDPDNEQINDSFAQLLQKAQEDNCSFAIGNMIRYRGNRQLVRNSRYLKSTLFGESRLTGENKDLLSMLNYRPMSIQALVADANWLKSIGITQPEGAVGQDSYFFQQMFYYASSISVLSLPIHVYYAEVSNSTVNTVSTRFFEKYIPLEKARSRWLEEIGLKEHYLSGRFKTFLKDWYMAKLELVPIENREKSFEVIHDIVSLYGPEAENDPEVRAILSGKMQ